MPPKQKNNFSVRLSHEENEVLTKLSEYIDVSKADLMRIALSLLSKYIEANDRKLVLPIDLRNSISAKESKQ